MNIERRGFFSQLAALFAGIPVMPKITFHDLPCIPVSDNSDHQAGSFTAHFDPDPPPDEMTIRLHLTDAQVKELQERIEALYKGPRDSDCQRTVTLDQTFSIVKPLK